MGSSVHKRNGIAQFPREITESVLLTGNERLQPAKSERGSEYARIALVAVMTLLCSHKFSRPYATIDMLGPAVACIGGYPIFRAALASLLRRHLTRDLSLTIAVIIAFLIGEPSTALVIILFALLTKKAEEKIIAWGRQGLHRLLQAQCSSTAITVEQAFQFPASAQRTADWLLGFFICLSLGAGLFTFLATHDVRSAFSIIVVGGVGVLTSSSLVGILGAFARAAGHGVFIKSTASWEELANVDVMVLDEPGRPQHPAASAAALSPADSFCSNTRRAVAALKKMKIETILLTSSLEPIASLIGEKLGVERVEAELFPEDKCCKLAALQRGGRKVAVLSDDVKVGSALPHADVAVVIGAAASVAENIGDALFVSDNLIDFVDVLAMARRTQRITTGNFVAAVLVSSLGIGFAMAGRLNPSWAIAVRFASDLVLLLNAARLLPVMPTVSGCGGAKAELYARE